MFKTIEINESSSPAKTALSLALFPFFDLLSLGSEECSAIARYISYPIRSTPPVLSHSPKENFLYRKSSHIELVIPKYWV